MRSLMNYARAQRALRLSETVLERRLMARGRRLLKARAERLAEYFVSSAVNRGFRETWVQGVREGWLDRGLRAVWHAQGDERVCEECEGLDGTEVGIGGLFDNGSAGPPAHYRCRCTLVLVEPERYPSGRIKPPRTAKAARMEEDVDAAYSYA